MSETDKEKTRLLIRICTRSLSQMIAGAVLQKPDYIEDGRRSLEQSLCELAGVGEGFTPKETA